ncbi:MAG: hypothetical protein K8T20_10700 [Planctomycetes bacterium]|nr:hypothetical protein [Planctomycetota bacterium]
MNDLPAAGPVGGDHAYHLMPADSFELVEASLARAESFRSTELAQISATDPESIEKAGKVREILRKHSAWLAAETAEDISTLSGDKLAAEQKRQDDAREKFGTEVAETIATASVPTARALLALTWLEPEDYVWRQSEDLGRAIDKLCDSHAGEVHATWEKQAMAILRKAMVSEDDIAQYLTDLNTLGSSPTLSCPFAPPGRFGKLGKLQGRSFTTDFILRFESFDRGEIFRQYMMDSESLAGLDTDRISDLVASLWHSRADRLRTVAFQIIRRARGTKFVDLVWRDMMDAHPFAWRVFDKNGALGTECVRKLVELGDQGEPSWGRAVFWTAMKSGECFEPEAVERAIGSLREVERGEPGNDERARLARELLSFLKAARESRGDPKESLLNGEEFERWFGKRREGGGK